MQPSADPTSANDWVERVLAILGQESSTPASSGWLFRSGHRLFAVDWSVLRTIYGQRLSVRGVLKEIAGGTRLEMPTMQRVSTLPPGFFGVVSPYHGYRKVFCYLPHEGKFIKIAFGPHGKRELEREVLAVLYVRGKGLTDMVPRPSSVKTADEQSWISSPLVYGSRSNRPVPFALVCELLSDMYSVWGHEKVAADAYLTELEEGLADIKSPSSPAHTLIATLRSHFGEGALLMTFTHGDLGPSNILMNGDRRIVVDWSSFGRRSMLYDASENVKRGCTIRQSVERLTQHLSYLQAFFPGALDAKLALAYYGVALLEHERQLRPGVRSRPHIRAHNDRQFAYVQKLLT